MHSSSRHERNLCVGAKLVPRDIRNPIPLCVGANYDTGNSRCHQKARQPNLIIHERGNDWLLIKEGIRADAGLVKQLLQVTGRM